MTTLRQALDLRMTEADMRAGLLEAAAIGGWEHFHVRDSRGQDVTDWPDDPFLRDGHWYWWELKKHGKNPTRGQARVLAAIHAFIDAHGLQEYMEAAVIHPEDYDRALAILMARREQC